MHATIVTLVWRTRQTGEAALDADIGSELLPLVQKLKCSPYSFAKLVRLSQQAEDEISVVGKIVEMTGVDQHRTLAKQIDRQILVGSGYGHSQNGIPSPFNLQPLGSLLLRQLAVELHEIRTDAVEK